MRIGFKTLCIGSLITGGILYVGSQVADANKEHAKQAKESVKTLNPKRYNEIINSKDSNNTKVWNDALNEICDTLRKLNSDAEKGYFRANELMKENAKKAVKVIK